MGITLFSNLTLHARTYARSTKRVDNMEPRVVITLFLMATCVHCFIRYPGYSYYPRHPKSIGYNSYNNLLHYSRQIPNQRQRLTGYNTGFINAELASIHHDI